MMYVRMTPAGYYLKVGFKETHVGSKPYLYETTALDNADLFNERADKSGTIRKMDEHDQEVFNRSIPIAAREERKVVLVHPDEKESEE